MTKQQEFRKQTEEAKFEAFALMCEKVAELEKENAELKKQQFSLRNERNTFFAQNEQYEKDLIDFNENLTKAKEIIKHLLDWQYDEYKKSETDKELFKVIVKAEQFLEEIKEND